MSSTIENFDSLARLLLEARLNTLWQGMLIAVLVWLLLRLVNRLSATTRHAVWLLTLLTIGALPLFAIIANRNDPAAHPATIVRHEQSKPAVRVAAPAFANQPGAERPSPVREAEGTDQFSLDNEASRLNIPANQEKVIRESNPQPQGQEPNPAPRRFDDGARRSTVEEPSASPVATTPGTLDSPKVESQTFRRRMKSFVANSFSGPAPLALSGLWIAICALMSWRVARSYRAVFRLRSGLEPAPSEHNARVGRLASLFGIKRPAPVFTSEQVVMPMTIGSLKPLIILPPRLADSLSQSEFESVVAHELAHIKRWDYLTNMLQRFVQSYLFFHPAVWFICKQLLIERELACDDWAVKTCEPRRYASCLTKLVEALNESKTSMAVRVAATSIGGIGGIVFGKHVISRRVEMILNRDRNATTAVSKPALLYAIGLVVMFVAVCSLISPVIAVPLGQNPAKQSKKMNKAGAPAKSQELPPLPPVPPLPPEVAVVDEPSDIFDIPDIPDVPNSPEPPHESPESPVPPAAPLAPGADQAPLPGGPIGGVRGGVSGGIPGGVSGGIPGEYIVRPDPPVSPSQGPRASTVAPLAPEPPAPAAPWESLARGPRGAMAQDDKNRQPAIPESELLNLLVDVVKRDSDPNVREEAMQGICRMRSDSSINALIQLYDGTSDAKIKSEIIPYLLRREGRDSKVDNSKAIAKLTTIAKSEQNEELRNKAVRYLGAVKGDEGADVLIKIYDGLQDQKMKRYIIRSLAQNRSRKAVDKLIQIAKNDSDPVVRQSAIRSLYNVDNQRYLELIDKDRARIGMIDGQFFTPEPKIMAVPIPRVFKYNGEPFEFDSKEWKKKWEEWGNEWRKNWEEQSENLRETIEKMRLDGLEKLKIEDIQNGLRIELPRIEIQLKDLEDKVRLGVGINNVSLAESQLRSQLVVVESQLAAMRGQYSDTNPKMVEMRNLKNALQKQLNSVRSMRAATPRPAPTPNRSVTPNTAPVVITTSSL
jgi:beta-lactamase regulating signal transducer with metallopeptidase domain/HEAT repeat protein